ncbi:MAG: AAA-like domain-containing protein, partial [Phormidesmis sp. CAN_BIN44]|nr:AAA-like domain-containing protein [Phormidesmis sp. CAN_BIN44]
VLENVVGQAQLVKSSALAGLFELFADKVECVVLNACYSEVQAVAIAHHIPYVVGMNQAVGDRAARVFAVGFYDALGAGESIDFAYKLGRNRIALEGIDEDMIPVIRKKSDVETLPLPEPLEPANLAKEPSIPAGASRSEVVSLDEPEGQVPLESLLYVERPPIEGRCYEAIVKPGALIRIKAPRQMGKSSLMLRILNHANQQGGQTATLNFQMVDRGALSNLDQFLQWFCNSITNEVNLSDKLADYWKGAVSPKNKCTNYFQRYLLPELQSPVTLCLDEVDQVFEYPTIAIDFFGMLRAWHEDAKIKPIWKNLRLVIVHSKEVYIPLNINQSPFNVGVPVELPPLTQPQVMDLVQRHGLTWAEPEVTQLMGMVGGHPYLIREALYQIARGELSLEQLLHVAPTEGGLYGEHLRRHLLNLEGDEKLLTAMKQVIAGDQPVSINTSEAFKLTSMGLVQFRGSDVTPSCGLYRQYFRERLRVSG